MSCVQSLSESDRPNCHHLRIAFHQLFDRKGFITTTCTIARSEKLVPKTASRRSPWTALVRDSSSGETKGYASTYISIHPPQLFDIPKLILVIPNIRHRHVLHTVLGLGNGKTIPPKRPDIAILVVLDMIMLVPGILHELQVMVQAARPNVDTSIGFVILKESSQSCTQT